MKTIVTSHPKYLILLIFAIAGILSPQIALAENSPSTSDPLARLIARGDIHRTQPPAANAPWLPLYQGNGRWGGCFGPFGLQIPKELKTPWQTHGNTHFLHMRHFARLDYGMDYLLPLVQIYWQPMPDPADILEYDQHQSFYDGTIVTKFRTADYKVTLTTWLDPVHRNAAGVVIDLEGNSTGTCPPILVAPMQKLDLSYGQKAIQTFKHWQTGDIWVTDVRCANAQTMLYVKSNAKPSRDLTGLKLDLVPGRNEMMIFVNEEPSLTAAQSLEASISAWHEIWGRTAWLDLPDARAEQMWVRSMAYILYSCNDDGFGPPSPTAFAANRWPYPFAEDLSFIHSVLMASGHVNIGKAWLEYYRSQLEGYQLYTQRRFHKSGVMMPWNTPYGCMAGYHDPDPPNHCSNELHNSGYIAHMAYDTAVMLDDPDWAARVADPFLIETAKFFADIVEKKDDGLWHMYVFPSFGQDEFGGDNQKNYLCAMFSAQYAMQKSVERNLDATGRIRQILSDGLAFKAITSPAGMYYTCQGQGPSDFGKQKHPVQLNPLALLPIFNGQPDEPTRKAFQNRYDITENAKNAHFSGWTLGTFILADARMHDVEAFRKDWTQLEPAHYVDPDWIQIYESSERFNTPFYVTSHGFLADALMNTVVQSWWGRLDLGACLPWPGTTRFANIRSPLGVVVSGDITDGRGSATLTAWKDCSFPCGEQTITLKKGQSLEIPIGKK